MSDRGDDDDAPSAARPLGSDVASRLRRAFGCSLRAIAAYRFCVSVLLLIELSSRFRYLRPFYSDEGTLPLRLMRPKVDAFYRVVCVHSWFGSLAWQRLLLSVQCGLAVAMSAGGGRRRRYYRPRACAFASWFLYLSSTLRNTWLAYILDRYFHYLLFYASVLPIEEDLASFVPPFSNHQHDDDDEPPRRPRRPRRGGQRPSSSDVVVCDVATVALKCQILWIYLDAGWGKYSDPAGGWTLDADPLPALDTYARHTVAARYLYAALGPRGLRLLTPTVVYAELLVGPVAVAGGLWKAPSIVRAAVVVACSLHVGIALCMNNTALLSGVACAAWAAWWPPAAAAGTTTTTSAKTSSRYRSAAVVLLVLGSAWFETRGEECGHQSNRHVWTTLLHNRWNVFVGAEEYVTWEIAPGRLADGSVVDVWARSDRVSWDMPVRGAPSTSTARRGRWRSFPYLAGLEGEDGRALWDYLCREWNADLEHENDERRLLRYNFFMLQADVRPNMGFSATRKRLIRAHECDVVDANDDDDQNRRTEEL